MKSLIAIAALVAAQAACAQATPAGLWKTVDEDSKRELSLVRIAGSEGVWSGRIEKLLGTMHPDARCDKCVDARKDQPIVGLAIIEGVKKNAEEGYWDGGTILDPGNGKTYRVRLTPKEGGKLLEVRGYLGPFYRNQTWIRVE